MEDTLGMGGLVLMLAGLVVFVLGEYRLSRQSRIGAIASFLGLGMLVLLAALSREGILYWLKGVAFWGGPLLVIAGAATCAVGLILLVATRGREGIEGLKVGGICAGLGVAMFLLVALFSA